MNVLLASLALHCLVIVTFENVIFDEVYYVTAAKATMYGLPANVEHTPLAKVIVGIFIRVFGDWWFSWRLPIVVMAVASVYVCYRLAKNFMSEKYALVAATFLSFDILYFVHGSIFMLEIPTILFGLLGMMFYFEKRFRWMAVAFGVCFLMKEIGLVFPIIILVYHVVQRQSWKKLAVPALLFLTLSLGGLWVYDIVVKPMNVTNPIEHLLFQYRAFTDILPRLNTSASEIRQPWSWVLPIGNSLNSVYRPEYTWNIISPDGSPRMIIKWVAQVCLPISYCFIPIYAWSWFKTVKRKGESFDKLFIIWPLFTFLPFVIRGLFYPMSFTFYFCYTIPAVCMSIAYVYSKMHDRRKTLYLALHLLATVLFFLEYFPIIVF